jgi:hypothetical protein
MFNMYLVFFEAVFSKASCSENISRKYRLISGKVNILEKFLPFLCTFETTMQKNLYLNLNVMLMALGNLTMQPGVISILLL